MKAYRTPRQNLGWNSQSVLYNAPSDCSTPRASISPLLKRTRFNMMWFWFLTIGNGCDHDIRVYLAIPEMGVCFSWEMGCWKSLGALGQQHPMAITNSSIFSRSCFQNNFRKDFHPLKYSCNRPKPLLYPEKLNITFDFKQARRCDSDLQSETMNDSLTHSPTEWQG